MQDIVEKKEPEIWPEAKERTYELEPADATGAPDSVRVACRWQLLGKQRRVFGLLTWIS